MSELLQQQSKNIVTIENFDDIKESFKSAPKKKGSLRLGTYWTAYNRENLGTIPRKVENIIINEKTDNVKKGFLSNTGRFSQRSENVKFDYPGPGAYSTDVSSIDKSGISIYSAKGYGNGFISEKPRFDDYHEFQSKYLPGPSDYLLQNQNIKKRLEKSLYHKNKYKKQDIVSLKEEFFTPGPGFYNTDKESIINNLKKINGVSDDASLFTNTFYNPNTTSHFFKSTTKRFKNGFAHHNNKDMVEEKEKMMMTGMARQTKMSTTGGFNPFNNTNYTCLTTDVSDNNTRSQLSTIYNFNLNKTKMNLMNVGQKEDSKNVTLYNGYKITTNITDNSMNNTTSVFPQVYTGQFSGMNINMLKTNSKTSYNTLLNNAHEASEIKPILNQQSNTLSHFFKPQSPPKLDPLKNVGIKKSEKEENINGPGPGSYNLKSEIGLTKEEIYKPHTEFLKMP